MLINMENERGEERFRFLDIEWDIQAIKKYLCGKPATEVFQIREHDIVQFFGDGVAGDTGSRGIIGIDKISALSPNVDISAPIVLARVATHDQSFTFILDGYRRLYKAWMNGRTHIPCYVLSEIEKGQFRTAQSTPSPLLRPRKNKP